jgi:hypothetical protein
MGQSKRLSSGNTRSFELLLNLKLPSSNSQLSTKKRMKGWRTESKVLQQEQPLVVAPLWNCVV